MEQNLELIAELQKINKNLDKINHPGKKILSNFVNGAAHTLGSIFGTLIIVSISFYLLSKVNLSKPISQWIENTLSQVKWEKITTTPVQQQIEQIQSVPTAPEGN